MWPLPMYAAHYVFSKTFFSAWLIIAIIWLWCTLFIAGFYPIIDGRQQILAVMKGLFKRRYSKSPSGSSSEIGEDVAVGGKS